jgi:hypothetical protein
MSAAHTALVIGGGIAGPVAATALTMAGPLPLSWAIGLIPLALALGFYVAVWVRTGSPNKRR